jgi:hypothetical protein
VKTAQENDLRILTTQQSQLSNQDLIDEKARDLEIFYRKKEVEASIAKLTFYYYIRGVIHAKRLKLQ